MLTLADALAAKKAKMVARTNAKTVAATIKAAASDDDVTMATVLPESPGRYKSDSSEDWSTLSDHDVSADIRAKHFIWDCQILGLIDDFPVKTRALLDNGAHLVLIHPELVTQLGLKTYKLHKLEIIDVAFNTKKQKKTELYDYVKLSVMSLDSHWSACTVKALVAPGLCTPIILSLLWLIQNLIVIDHATHTCIDKYALYDLMNPPIIVPPPPPKPVFTGPVYRTENIHRTELD
jgi:hypothetical protein